MSPAVSIVALTLSTIAAIASVWRLRIQTESRNYAKAQDELATVRAEYRIRTERLEARVLSLEEALIQERINNQRLEASYTAMERDHDRLRSWMLRHGLIDKNGSMVPPSSSDEAL